MYDSTTIKKAQALLSETTRALLELPALVDTDRNNYGTSEEIDRIKADLVRAFISAHTSIFALPSLASSLERAEKAREDLFDSLDN